MNHTARSDSTEMTFCDCSWPGPTARQDVLHFEHSSLGLPCSCCGMSQRRTCSHFLVSQRPWMNINCNTITEMPSGKQKFCKHKNITISNIKQSQQWILGHLCLKQTLHSFVSWRMSGSCYLLFSVEPLPQYFRLLGTSLDHITYQLAQLN